MVPSLSIKIFLIIYLTQNLECHSVRMKAATVGSKWDVTDERFYQYDWQLDSNRIVPSFSRNFDSHNQFAFVAYDPSDKSKTDVVTIDLGPTDGRGQRICRSQDFLHSDEPKFRRVFVGEGDKKTKIVKILYTDGESKGPGIWIHNVDMTNCKSTEGLIYAVADVDADPDMFPNDTTEEERAFQKIVMSSGSQTRAISRNDRYGHCVLKNNEVTCYQRSWNGRICMKNTKLKLRKRVDWFAVHNLKSNGMLIATGDCPANDCQSFTVRKLEEEDKVTKEIFIRTLGIKCIDPSKSLTVDFADEEGNNRFCLNFACTYRESFQYRKHCFDRDFFEHSE